MLFRSITPCNALTPLFTVSVPFAVLSQAEGSAFRQRYRGTRSLFAVGLVHSSSPVLSSTCELPIPQAACFHNHLRCRGVVLVRLTKNIFGINFLFHCAAVSRAFSQGWRLLCLSLQCFESCKPFFSIAYRLFFANTGGGGVHTKSLPSNQQLTDTFFQLLRWVCGDRRRCGPDLATRHQPLTSLLFTRGEEVSFGTTSGR